MKAIAKITAPAVLAVAAFGVSAQTIETDYPAVGGSFAATSSQSGPVSQSEPYLIQSNSEGVRANPTQAPSSTVSRAEVQREAVVMVPRSGHNA